MYEFDFVNATLYSAIKITASFKHNLTEGLEHGCVKYQYLYIDIRAVTFKDDH